MQDLSALFLDFDSYFASVEQHHRPELRDKPIAITPAMAETSCCIAASYPAKAKGIKTGTRVAEARQLCPDITILPARHSLYIETHQQCITLIERHIHVEAVLSIDELWAWLPYNWRTPEKIHSLIHDIHQDLATTFSPALTCSIGIAPNRWLAKIASKINKPNGHHIIRQSDLPHTLFTLNLSDIHGIGRNTELCLHAHGIHTVEDLCHASSDTLYRAWGNIEGRRIHLQLRGQEITDLPTTKRTISHSNILCPQKRRPQHALPVLHKLTQKAASRLRSYDLLASALHLSLRYLNGERWQQKAHFEPTFDSLFFAKCINRLWQQRPHTNQPLRKLSITLHHLTEPQNYTPSLFTPPTPHRRALNQAIDTIQQRYGKQSLHIASTHDALDSENMRIAFSHIPDLDTEKD